MADPAARRAAFRLLHREGCFVMPNPPDIGTARFLAAMGFPALATTSAGFAFAQGLPDAEAAVPLEAMLAHIAQIAAATDLPVNADFESGYAGDAAGLGANVAACIATGVAGLSIEDATGRPGDPLHTVAAAVERVRAARAAIDAAGADVMLTARAECFLTGHPDPLPEAIRRLQAYAEAGADVVYAPGPVRAEEIRTLVRALAPVPVNVLMGGDAGLTVADLADLGVRRISVGGALARAAWGGFLRAVRPLRETGSFAGFREAASFAELNDFFQRHRRAEDRA